MSADITLEISINDESDISLHSVFSTQQEFGLSAFIPSQFPQFVQEDHEKFVDFVQTYYKWMESQGNALYDSHRIKNYQDIDTSIDAYTEQFFKEFLVHIPRNILVNKALLLKNVKQFYRAKGTEKSFKMFFRMLYNINCEFYYPRVDILRASDGKWIQERTIRVFVFSGNVSLLKAQRVVGKWSNVSAVVEQISVVKEDALLGYELLLNRSTITGAFIPNEPFECIVEDYSNYSLDVEKQKIVGIISPVPTKLKITQTGAGYKVGQIFRVNKIGRGAKIKVTEVDVDGGVVEAVIMNPGIGYDLEVPLTGVALIDQEIFALTENLAQVDLTLGALVVYPGYYANEDGQLSTLKYLQDGEFYQQHSYVLYTSESVSSYKNALNQLLHPVGFKLFGTLRNETKVVGTITIPEHTSEVVRQILSQIVHAKPKIRTAVSVVKTCILDQRAAPLGPSHGSIERDKFKYKPVSKYDANTEIQGTNNYFGEYNNLTNQRAITPISVFDKIDAPDRVGPKAISAHPSRRTKILPDSVVISKPKDEEQ